MNWKTLCVTCLFLGAFVVGMQTAAEGLMINLNARDVSSATPTGQGNVTVHLGPGTYTVKPVGVAGGGLFKAWSAFSSNLGCDSNGENCTRGFENEFEFQSASLPFTLIGDGKRYATALQALSHAQSATFTLTAAEEVHFGLNDCPGCLGDNRGGNSLEITALVNLDAKQVSSATPTGQGNVTVHLGPGIYKVKLVGVAGGGLFDAWSAFSSNLGCDSNGENCTRGFENEFEFQSASLPFTLIGDGKRYATALQALSHAQSAMFTLTAAEEVHFGLNDCPGCLGDNRGGNSLEITVPPDVFGCLSLRGAPLANRTVMLTQTGEVTQITRTNTNGCYEFARVVPGKRFNVSMKGPVVP